MNRLEKLPPSGGKRLTDSCCLGRKWQWRMKPCSRSCSRGLLTPSCSLACILSLKSVRELGSKEELDGTTLLLKITRGFLFRLHCAFVFNALLFCKVNNASVLSPFFWDSTHAFVKALFLVSHIPGEDLGLSRSQGSDMPAFPEKPLPVRQRFRIPEVPFRSPLLPSRHHGIFGSHVALFLAPNLITL